MFPWRFTKKATWPVPPPVEDIGGITVIQPRTAAARGVPKSSHELAVAKPRCGLPDSTRHQLTKAAHHAVTCQCAVCPLPLFPFAARVFGSPCPISGRLEDFPYRGSVLTVDRNLA